MSDIDPRHQRRIEKVQALFAYDFYQPEEQENFDSEQLELITDILPQVEQLDQEIQPHAPERPLSEINRVDLAILRYIVWESNHKNTPKKVLIDEAVELAKELGSESSPKFINGVLGQMLLPEEK